MFEKLREEYRDIWNMVDCVFIDDLCLKNRYGDSNCIMSKDEVAFLIEKDSNILSIKKIENSNDFYVKLIISIGTHNYKHLCKKSYAYFNNKNFEVIVDKDGVTDDDYKLNYKIGYEHHLRESYVKTLSDLQSKYEKRPPLNLSEMNNRLLSVLTLQKYLLTELNKV